MNPTWKAAIGVILIFILGWFGGALSTLIIGGHKLQQLTHNPEAMAVMLERQTTRGIKLDDGQKAQIHQLLLKNIRERTQLQKQIQPQVWVYNRETVAAINTLLTSDQQQKFQDNLLLFKAHFGRDPLNTGPDENAAAPTPPTATASSNAAVGTPPPQ
jgi:hypothetical protein